MQLSNNFRLIEFTRSDTAKRLGIENQCSSVEQVLNLAYLCHMVLQPLRDRFGPIRITSGYRCPELNRAVGGVKNSQHLRGEAADIHLPSVDKGLEYLAFLKTLPAVDELIWERNGNTHWIHVSAKRVKDPSPASPRVELESSPLPRHRSTFSASSEDLARPLWEGVVTTVNAITHFLPLRQAGVPRRGEGVDKTLCALLS